VGRILKLKEYRKELSKNVLCFRSGMGIVEEVWNGRNLSMLSGSGDARRRLHLGQPE